MKSFCGHMVCSYLFNSQIWIISGTNKSSTWQLWEMHMYVLNWGKEEKKKSNWVFHTRCATSQISSPFPLRCSPWVWSPCPTMTGSTRWTRGCGTGWASYPLQRPPCCGRRESCQRPRAAATAQRQTGARGSSHLVLCAGVHVYVCVCLCESVRRSRSRDLHNSVCLCSWGLSSLT